MLSVDPTDGVALRITASNVPQHIRKEWLPILARLQQLANTQAGMAIVNMQIVVDEEGKPVCWIEPTMRRIEPRSRARLIRELFFGPLDDPNVP